MYIELNAKKAEPFACLVFLAWTAFEPRLLKSGRVLLEDRSRTEGAKKRMAGKRSSIYLLQFAVA